MTRAATIQALRALLDAIGVRPDELGPLREPKPVKLKRGVLNLRRGASVTAKAQAAAKGHDLSRFYKLGEGHAQATCYNCGKEGIIIFEGDSVRMSGPALEKECPKG